MKNLFKVFGIIALVAVIGFSMAACDTGNNGGGDTSIDKTALNDVILEAGIAKDGVEIASSASEVPTGKKWVTQSAWDAFDTVYKTAVETKANPSSQSAVNNAKTNLQTALVTFNAAKKEGSGRAITLSGTITVKNNGKIVPYVLLQTYTDDWGWSESTRLHLTDESTQWEIITKPFSSSTDILFFIEGYDNDKYEDFIFRVPVAGLSKTVYNTNVYDININQDLRFITLSGTLNLDYNGKTIPSAYIEAVRKNDGSILGVVNFFNVRNNTTWSMMIPTQNAGTDVVFTIVCFDGPIFWEYDTLIALWGKDFGVKVGNQNQSGVALNLITISGTVNATYKGSRVPVGIHIRRGDQLGEYIAGTTLRSPSANAPWSIVIPAFTSDTVINIGIGGLNENDDYLFWNGDTTRTVKDKNVSGIVLDVGNITE